jgi:hypothetical protein
MNSSFFLALVSIALVIGIGIGAGSPEAVQPALNWIAAVAIVQMVIAFAWDKVWPALSEPVDSESESGSQRKLTVLLVHGNDVVGEMSSWDTEHLPEGRRKFWAKKLPRLFRLKNEKAEA